MAMLHQEIDAVLFERNGIGIVVRNALDDLNVGNIKFVAPWSALIRSDFAFNDDAGFLGETLHCIEHFRRDCAFGNHALDHATAITEYREKKFAAFAEIVEPAADGDGLAFMLADFSDCSDRCHYLGDFHRREKQIPRFSRNDIFQINVRSRDQGSRLSRFLFTLPPAVERSVLSFLWDSPFRLLQSPEATAGRSALRAIIPSSVSNRSNLFPATGSRPDLWRCREYVLKEYGSSESRVLPRHCS